MLTSLANCLHADMYVVWLSGKEKLRVFDYDSETNVFTATPFAAGRVSITVGGSTVTFAIQSVDAAVFFNTGELRAERFVQGALGPPTVPRIEFIHKLTNASRWATITKDGLVVSNGFRAGDISVETTQFRFLGEASIGADGIVADKFTATLGD